MATITKQGQKGNLTKLDLDYEGTKDGEDQVKNYLEIVQQKLGFIPNVLAAFAKFPKQFEGFTKLYNALMLGESGLSKLEREMIAVTVSSENCAISLLSLWSGTDMVTDLRCRNRPGPHPSPGRRGADVLGAHPGREGSPEGYARPPGGSRLAWARSAVPSPCPAPT